MMRLALVLLLQPVVGMMERCGGGKVTGSSPLTAQWTRTSSGLLRAFASFLTASGTALLAGTPASVIPIRWTPKRSNATPRTEGMNLVVATMDRLARDSAGLQVAVCLRPTPCHAAGRPHR